MGWMLDFGFRNKLMHELYLKGGVMLDLTKQKVQYRQNATVGGNHTLITLNQPVVVEGLHNYNG